MARRPRARKMTAMPGWRRRVVLIVEDDHELQSALCDALRDEGYSVDAVSDGVSALRWLRENRTPSLIVMDLWMPGMDGWQLRRQLQAIPSLARIPIVVLSAARAQSADVLGVAAVLEKPLSVERLLAAIEQHAA